MRTLLLQVGCAMRTLLLQVGCAMRTLLLQVGCEMCTLLLRTLRLIRFHSPMLWAIASKFGILGCLPLQVQHQSTAKTPCFTQE